MHPVLRYYRLSERVMAFSTTRHGGCSVGPYGELNINGYCGDNPEHIGRNRQLLAAELRIENSRIVMAHQVHGDTCRLVDEALMAMPDDKRGAALEGVDCIVTDARQLCIGVSTADCIPILLYDAARHVSAAVHAGWRGTVKRIAAKAVAAMERNFGSCAEDLQAIIGPGISLKNFEVGQEVYDAFRQAGHPMEQIAKRYEKWHIDLPLSNRLQLEQSGVDSKQIIMTGVCTYDAKDDYFSARRLGVDSGRIYTGIILR